MLTEKITTPTIQVGARPSRQPAAKYRPQRWSTMKTKKTWTAQKWRLFTKCPTPDTCHHPGPKNASTTPLPTVQTSAAIATTPKT